MTPEDLEAQARAMFEARYGERTWPAQVLEVKAAWIERARKVHSDDWRVSPRGPKGKRGFQHGNKGAHEGHRPKPTG